MLLLRRTSRGCIGRVANSSSAAKNAAPPAPGNPFHLAIPVHSIPEARKFYGGILGLKEGRRAGDKWQDYSLYGHQVVCHYVGGEYRCNDYYNPVDGDEGNSTIWLLSLSLGSLLWPTASLVSSHLLHFISFYFCLLSSCSSFWSCITSRRVSWSIQTAQGGRHQLHNRTTS